MRTVILALLAAVVVGAGGAYVYATSAAAIPAIERPAPSAFDRRLVQKGESLAGLGNCNVCHSVRGGAPYAGGRALPTPFGTIYTTNITPDPETGIGRWSLEAFSRAMREGLDREGRHLYPAFPYDYFRNITDEDMAALYAYLMTRQPVSAEAKPNALDFPFNVRLLLAGWKALFLPTDRWAPDPSKDAEWNRGAYLVEGLGHCGACHSPRNALGAPARAPGEAHSGGLAEGWYVPPLTATTPSPIPWTQIALVNYLIDGWDEHQGIAAGPMAPVSSDLYAQSEDDVFAIAAYLMHLKGGELPEAEQEKRTAAAVERAKSLRWGAPGAPGTPDDPLLREGARVFEAQCSTCHKAGAPTVPLALGTTATAPDASNLVHVVFAGIQPPRGSLDKSMPARAIQISDQEMVALAAFVRTRFGSGPAWTGVDETVRRVRAEVAAGH